MSNEQAKAIAQRLIGLRPRCELDHAIKRENEAEAANTPT
jgi:hypothetical protein